MQYNIGIIGFGFVGRAIHHGFAQTTNFRIYDKNPKLSENTLEETVRDSDFIFVSVPTPTNMKTGECDTSILEGVIEDIKKYLTPKKIVIIKSTIEPGTTKKIKDKAPHLRIVFNPEFLTERTYKLDFINTSRIILGGDYLDCLEVANLYRERFPEGSVPIYITDSTTAELVKYMSNCFLASKVMIFNEFYDICEALGVDYNEASGLVLADNRIGRSHTDVPGHDGDRGIGGKCFPKDLNALIKKAKDLGLDPIILKAIWNKNLKIRKNKDWLEIKGATLSNK